MSTPSSGHTDFVTTSFTKASHTGFWKLTLAGSISKVSRTSVSTSVRSPWPNGACTEHHMISFASRSLSGNPTSSLQCANQGLVLAGAG